MNFDSDYANDLLRELEKIVESEGGSADWIYECSDFIEECQRDFETAKNEVKHVDANVSRYILDFNNRQREIRNIRRCRNAMDKDVYRKMLSRAVTRRRKVMHRFEDAEELLANLNTEVKELEVLTHAQMTGLRRFWDHPAYKIESIGGAELREITNVVHAFCPRKVGRMAA